MFESIKSKFQSESDDNVSPADVALDVSRLHETLDEMKEWSQQTEEWLVGEQRRLEVEEGDTDYVSELDDLIAYVQSVYLRIEYGDYAVSNAQEEGEKAAGGEE